MVRWSDKICMASDGKSRCSRASCNDNDFCEEHMKKHTYDKSLLCILESKHATTHTTDNYVNAIVNKLYDTVLKQTEELNQNYLYCLFGVEDSWDNIPLMYRYKCNNIWWDIRTLAKTLSMQLNQSESEKPYPIYPENPFTRVKFSIDEMMDFRDRIDMIEKLNNGELPFVHVALRAFLRIPLDKLKKIRDRPIDDEYTTEKSVQYKTATSIIKQFSKKLRYKMINHKDSQGRYCGYWVYRREKFSVFEKCYDKIIHATIALENMSVFVDTREFRAMLQKIKILPQENYNI